MKKALLAIAALIFCSQASAETYYVERIGIVKICKTCKEKTCENTQKFVEYRVCKKSPDKLCDACVIYRLKIDEDIYKKLIPQELLKFIREQQIINPKPTTEVNIR